MNKFMSLQRRLQLIPLTLAATLLVGCGEDVNNNYGVDADGISSTSLDTDKDGLTDAEEVLLGTSPRLKDTDGDGFSDFEEVIEFGFNPENNNYRFNPLIADIAKIGIEITSAPDIALVYERGSETSKVISTERAQSRATSQTVSNTSSTSRTIEETHSAGIEYSASATVGLTSVEGTAGFSVNYQYSHATSNESSVGYTKTQATENTQTLSEAESYETSNSETESSGSLELTMTIRNDSDLAFRVNGLTLGAVSLDNRDRRSLVPVGNLDIDTQFGVFPAFTLAPHEEAQNLVFSTDLLLDEAKGLLRDPKGLIINVASSQIVDSNNVAFAFRETEINTKTATILIDYAGLKASERYLVATNVNQETGRISIQDVLDKVLKISYSLDANGQLESVRDQLSADNGFWLAHHVTNDGLSVADPITLSPQENNGEVFSALELKSGDVLNLVFLQDADEDGVGLRSERLFGSDPGNPDSDNDGFSDGVEFTGFNILIDNAEGVTIERHLTSNPNSANSDGDELLDTEECDMSTLTCTSNPNLADTDGDRMLDHFDPQPAAYTNIDLVNFDASIIETRTPYLDFNLPVIVGAEISYAVYRQKVAIGETFCLNTDPDCVFTPVTLSVVEDTTTPGHFTLTDTAGAEEDHRFRYEIYLSVNGSDEILLDGVTLNTIAAQKQVTVTLSSLESITCVDEVSLMDSSKDDKNTNDLECELYGYIFVSGVSSDIRPVIAEEGAPLVIATLDNPNGSGTFTRPSVTFQVPDVPGQCIYIKPQLWEKDDFKVDSNTDDDRLYDANPNRSDKSYATQGSVHCQSDTDNWNDGQQVVGLNFQKFQDQFCADYELTLDFSTGKFGCPTFAGSVISPLVSTYSDLYNGLSENIEVDVVYTVTVTDVP